MEFLTPIAGYLALLSVPIIIFYILKIRLRQERISTIIFWQQVFEERRTRSIWRRLRHLLSLFLSLLFLTLLVLAILNPIFESQKKTARTIIIVDQSASMNALEPGGKTRLELAKTELQRYLSSTEVSNQTAIITAGGEPKVLVGFTNHLGTLRKKSDEIVATDSPTCLHEAIWLSRRLLADEKTNTDDSVILVLTDGCSKSIEPYFDAPSIRFLPVGTPLENVAITMFQPRRTIGDAVGCEVLTEVTAFVKEPIECRLEFELEGNLLDVIPLKLEPNVPQQIIKRYATEQGGVLKAMLGHVDPLPIDNTALALLPARPTQKVIFFGEPDFFLSHVLQSQPNTELSVVTECPASVPDDAVLIVHRTIPEMIPTGNVFIVDPQNDTELFAVGEKIDAPFVTNEAKNSPLMQFVHLNNVIVPGAKRLTFKNALHESEDVANNVVNDATAPLQENGVTVLASTPEEEPIYVLRNVGQNKTIILTAELKRGDLALRTAFPIMISNALNVFRGTGGELEHAYSTSEPVSLEVNTMANELSELTVIAPDQKTQVFPVKNGVISLGTLPTCGLWAVSTTQSLPVTPPSNQLNAASTAVAAPASETTSKPLKQIACNLVSADESNLQSAPERFYHLTQADKITASGRPIWFWLALTALIFSVTEWYLYQRRWVD